MKYQWHKKGKQILVTLTLTKCTTARVWLVWRDGNITRKLDLGLLTMDEPRVIPLDLSSLSAVHHLLIDATVAFYTRYIPARFLHLDREHD